MSRPKSRPARPSHQTPARRANNRALRAALLTRIAEANSKLHELRDEIDDIGADASEVGVNGAFGGPHGDTLGCWASNSLEGTLSLLRELGAAIAAPVGRRR